MKIENIIPYARNARHNEKAIPVVADSIREFGLRGQIVLESPDNPVIVTGHTRVEACKLLGWTEIPDKNIDFATDLTPEQIKAYRLADNKTGEVSKWNIALLKSEVRELGNIQTLDMSKFGFDFKSKVKPYGAERLKTDKAYNLDLFNSFECASAQGFPELEAHDTECTCFIPFNYCKSATSFDTGVHFFIDDYQFERLWNSPNQYLELVSKFECLFTPDFSLYMDMPEPLLRWNIYRARVLGYWWQSEGLTVIPTLSWAGSQSFNYCFEGLPKRGTYAVSTVGVAKDAQAYQIWQAGMAEALRCLKPKKLFLYGSDVDFDFRDIELVRLKTNTGFRERE